MPPTEASSVPHLDKPAYLVVADKEYGKEVKSNQGLRGFRKWMSAKLRKMFSGKDEDTPPIRQRDLKNLGGSCPDLVLSPHYRNFLVANSTRLNTTGHLLQSDIDYDLMLAFERTEFARRIADIDTLPISNSIDEDYIRQKKLGFGMFGDVYLAKKRGSSSTYVAIKEINYDGGPHTKKCAETERNYLYATNSPFIVSLLDFYKSDSQMCLVLEYLDGKDLFERLMEVGRFSEELTRFYTAQLVLALEYLHNVGLIHRDLKPENVMLTSDGFIKLVDLGLSKHAAKAISYVGTLGYRAPEIVMGHGYTKAVDWWALGILIYEMLMGPRRTPCTVVDIGSSVEHLIFSDKLISFPRDFRGSEIVQTLIRGLLKVRSAQRLGTGEQGSEKVRRHPWFYGVDWRAVYNKEINPPAPSATVQRKSRRSQIKVNRGLQKSSNPLLRER